MDQARRDKQNHVQAFGGEISLLLKRLTDYQLEDQRWGWAVDSRSDGTLSRLWWINPFQRTLVEIYGDVILVDVCEGRNDVDFHLTTFVVIDGENKSRDVAFCISERQDEDTFLWMFRQMNKYLSPRFSAVFTDRDPAMNAALQEIWSDKFHGICLWHLQKNLTENLGSVLRSNFYLFMRDFWEVYRLGSPPSFVIGWQRLLAKYPEAVTYLKNNIFPDRQKVHRPSM